MILLIVSAVAGGIYFAPALQWFRAWCREKSASARYDAIRMERTLKSYKRRVKLGMEP